MELTRICEHNIGRLAGTDMTPEKLIEFMESGAVYRNFGEILQGVYPASDLPARLTRGLSSVTRENEESIARKVRKWLRCEGVPQNREQLFQICFALGLNEEKANAVLSCTSETGIHYRNPKELVYAYCLRMGKGYREAGTLLERMMNICEAAPLLTAKEKEQKLRYTSQLRRVFSYVETEEELAAFFKAHSADLGEIHESAYAKFMELLHYLQQPEEGGQTYSIEAVMDQYLRMHIPNTKRTGGFTYLQRAVKKNWPSESVLLRMKNRKQDVSRKVLLLLFIVTEDFEVSRIQDRKESAFPEDDFDDMEDLMEEDGSARLEVRLTKINLFLDSYGMNRLDPGNPFDCLILYALKAGYDEEGDVPMSDELHSALTVLFGESMPDGEKAQE